MKITFSIYREDIDTSEDTLLFSKTVITDLTLAQIDNHLQLYEGFRSELEAGQYFAFWDIYCFFSDPSELLNRIEKIPTLDVTEKERNVPVLFALEKFELGEPRHPMYPEAERCFAYRLNRFECGASGAHALVVWASSHPWIMVFLGGLIWDAVKYITAKIFGWIRSLLFREKICCRPRRNVRMEHFLPKTFYKSFSQMTHIAPPDCQIVILKKLDAQNFYVLVRTISREYYLVESTRRGKISSVERIDGTTANQIFWS